MLQALIVIIEDKKEASLPLAIIKIGWICKRAEFTCDITSEFGLKVVPLLFTPPGFHAL